MDICNSSLRTVLGWPENPPRGKIVESFTLPSPDDLPYRTASKIDSYGKKPYPRRSYKDYAKIYFFFTAVLIDNDPIYYITRQEEIEKNFTAMKNDFELLLIDLQSETITQDELTSAIQSCNQIEADMRLFNYNIAYNASYDDNPKTRAEFIKKYNINMRYNVNPGDPNEPNIFF